MQEDNTKIVDILEEIEKLPEDEPKDLEEPTQEQKFQATYRVLFDDFSKFMGGNKKWAMEAIKGDQLFLFQLEGEDQFNQWAREGVQGAVVETGLPIFVIPYAKLTYREGFQINASILSGKTRKQVVSARLKERKNYFERAANLAREQEKALSRKKVSLYPPGLIVKFAKSGDKYKVMNNGSLRKAPKQDEPQEVKREAPTL